MRVPWTARRSNQSVLKEINSECSLGGLLLNLQLQYFVHLMPRADSLERTLMLGKIEAGGEGDNRRWDAWMASPTRCTWVWAISGRSWWTGRPGVLQFMGLQRVGHNWVSELTDWTDGTICQNLSFLNVEQKAQHSDTWYFSHDTNYSMKVVSLQAASIVWFP